MKISRKIGIVLTALVLIGVLWSGFSVSAEANAPLKSNGIEKNGVYRFSQMFGEKTEEWQYYWYDGTTSFLKMEYDKENKMWKGQSPATTSFISKAAWHTYTKGYTVATFTCPKSGTVRIGTEEALELLNVANTPDGTIFILMSDGEVLGTQVFLTKENPRQEFDVVTTDVYEGQVIEFHLYMNLNNAGDSTKVLPFVEYTQYKDVEKKVKETESKTETEPVLRTDIKPIDITDEATFVLNPVKMVIGAAPVLLIGIGILVWLIIVRKRGNKNG